MLSWSFGKIIHCHAEIIKSMTAVTIGAYSLVFFVDILFICTVARASTHLA